MSDLSDLLASGEWKTRSHLTPHESEALSRAQSEDRSFAEWAESAGQLLVNCWSGAVRHAAILIDLVEPDRTRAFGLPSTAVFRPTTEFLNSLTKLAAYWALWGHGTTPCACIERIGSVFSVGIATSIPLLHSLDVDSAVGWLDVTAKRRTREQGRLPDLAHAAWDHFSSDAASEPAQTIPFREYVAGLALGLGRSWKFLIAQLHPTCPDTVDIYGFCDTEGPRIFRPSGRLAEMHRGLVGSPAPDAPLRIRFLCMERREGDDILWRTTESPLAVLSFMDATEAARLRVRSPRKRGS